MKERPILFSGPMVCAILSGTKTQTRRLIKQQPEFNDSGCWYPVRPYGKGYQHSLHYASEGHFRKGASADWCPYGQPGDRLWVRESFQILESFYDSWTGGTELDEWKGPMPKAQAPGMHLSFAADGADSPAGDGPWRPSIHMPRWASRITLEIVSVRVERLNDISEADALEEGITYNDIPNNGLDPMRARRWFRGLWEQINGAGSWDANPWVWVVEFRRLPA